MDLVTRTKLSNRVQVSRNYVGYFRIAAGRLLFDKENDRLAQRRYLNSAERHAFCDHFAGRVGGNSTAFETNAHAIGLFGYAKGALAKYFPGDRKSTRLNSSH